MYSLYLCRGSLGYGQDSAQSLLGNIGTNDVSDCVQAVEECLKKISQGKHDDLQNVQQILALLVSKILILCINVPHFN